MKKIIRQKINYRVDWTDIKIDEVIEQLNEVKSKGADRIEVYLDFGFIEIDFIKSKIETDQEYEDRIAREKAIEKEKKAEKIKMYLKLKEELEL